jgi:molybdopterin-binding protein
LVPWAASTHPMCGPLTEGSNVTAVIKASDVILATGD